MNALAINRSALTTNAIYIAAGAAVIALATQVSFQLPFTPVPITGQSFGVILVALLVGRGRAVGAVLAYLAAGLMGLPVFAQWSSVTAFFGPTSGYLIAFIPAAWLAGWLVDRGLGSTVARSTGIGLLAHTVILLIGGAVLGAFVGLHNIWVMGIAPFLIGDVVKSTLAAIVACSIRGYLPTGERHGS